MMLPRRNLVSALLGLLLAGGPALTGTLLRAAEPSPAGKPFRPPAVPLVVHDPYFSIWSPADRLTDAETVHWTGRRHALSSLVRIDGAAYRVMGTEPQGVPALPQTSLVVGPTRTTYEFATEEVRLSLNFTTPFLPDDLDVLTRPVTYITYEAVAVDGRSHSVALYFDASAELTVDAPAQPIVWGREEAGDLAVLRAGSRDQRILARKGDDLRIDWGYLYAAAPRAEVTAHAVLP